jgi:hypothetical protein
MKKTILVLAVTIALLAVAFIPAFAAEEDGPDLVRLTLANDFVYYLAAPAGGTVVYTVERGVYDRMTMACGLTATGELDLSGQVRLKFTSCYREAPNEGEPGQEKVSLHDSPTGIMWRYQDIE